ncbi:MAG: hypothetical protein AAGI22_23135 [Planctomycetota bacterium]
MASLLALAVLAQSTWWVDASAVPPGDGSIFSPYTRIDHAVAQPTTLSGDTVLVLAGTYPDERIDVGGRELTIASVGGPDVTVVEGAVSGSIVTYDDFDGRSVLRGLTLRGGRGSFAPSLVATAGGAVTIGRAGVTVENCVFEDCEADFGGAISARRESAPSGLDRRLVVRESEFRATCRATRGGGAIHGVDVFVQAFDSTIDGHVSGGDGGAVHVTEDGFAATDCTVTGTATGNGGAIFAFRGPPQLLRTGVSGVSTAGGVGGGICVDRASFNRIEECRFVGCRAASGGAIHATRISTLPIERSWFEGNATTGSPATGPGMGGAIHSTGCLFLDDTVFVDNRALDDPRSLGGAVFGPLVAARCLFLGNDASLDGAAAYATGPFCFAPGVRRSIVTRAPGSTTPLINAGVTVTGSLIEDGYAGGVNISTEDPLLWGPRDPHLLPGSPAIGSNADERRGALPFDPLYCGPGCDGPIGLVSCVAQPHRLGYPATISGLGSLDVANDRVIINADDLPRLTTSYFVGGTSAAFVPGAGGGMGTLCVGGAVERFPLQPPTSAGGVISSFRPVLAGFPSGHIVTSGETWFFQLWFRDTVGGSATSNMSPSLYLRFE